MSMFKRRDPAQLAKQLETLKGNQYTQNDGSEWTLTTDTAGNGSAIIRFLPPKSEDSFPFIKLVNHGFKIGTGKKWYINNCTSTHGDFDNCPVCKYISDNDVYNTDNALFGKIKRKISYWANILVIKDPSAPENEGKVFKYRFGQKIMDKIDAMIQVDVDLDEVPVDVFCPFEGANFSLKAKKVGGFANYEDSKFLKQSKIANIDDEEYQLTLAKGMHDLEAMKTFEKFEKLSEEFKLVMGTSSMGSAADSASREADKIASELDEFETSMAEYESTPKTETVVQETTKEEDDLNSLIDGL